MCKTVSKSEIDEAILIVDEMIAIASGSDAVAKAGPDILTPKGFDKWVARYTKRVLGKATPADKRAVKRMVQALDKSWSTMTPAQADKAIRAGVKKLTLSAAETTSMSKVVAESMEEAIKATMKTAGARHNITAVYSAVDERVVKQVRGSQSHYIRDAYGRRQDALSAEARRVVSGGVRAGFDSSTIGELLSARMSTLGLLRAESYWTTVSGIYAARSRTYGHMRSFEEAEIERVRFEAILDERTTDVCEALDGKVIDVRQSIIRYNDIADSNDPEAVVDKAPFLQFGRDERGNEFIYYKQGETRYVAFDVLKERGATIGSNGQYRQKISDQKLQDAGLLEPPRHGHCRSTLTPI